MEIDIENVLDTRSQSSDHGPHLENLFEEIDTENIVPYRVQKGSKYTRKKEVLALLAIEGDIIRELLLASCVQSKRQLPKVVLRREERAIEDARYQESQTHLEV